MTLTQCDGTHLGFYLVIMMYAGGAGQGLSASLEREITVPQCPSLSLSSCMVTAAAVMLSVSYKAVPAEDGH